MRKRTTKQRTRFCPVLKLVSLLLFKFGVTDLISSFENPTSNIKEIGIKELAKS